MRRGGVTRSILARMRLYAEVCRLAHRDVRVPGNAEALLEQLYGPQWRVPDQGIPGIPVQLLLTNHGTREDEEETAIRSAWELPSSIRIRYFAYSAEDDRLFRLNVTGYSAGFAL
jgi:hypothetical protein